ncbi:MAG: transcription antitermination factor NusB [Calditrichaeota bacterium]|nr:MAG: transcription antitermination factor NusB [Calditrichota bacterium]
MKQRKRRECALKLLYAHEFNPITTDEQIENLMAEHKECGDPFPRKLTEVCLREQEKLDELIAAKLVRWDLNRVALMDRLILRMGLAEILYFEDIPPEVTMNEMIELGKKYSTDKSGKFVNGILDALIKSLIKENKIKKSGRGLLSDLM